MKNKTSKRREILKGAAIGSAWTAPVIQSVLIPAHAATTDSGGEPGGGVTTEPPCMLFSGVGSAGGSGGNRDIYVCAVVNGNSATVTQEAFDTGTANLCVSRRGTLTIDGGVGQMNGLEADNGCTITAASVPATLATSGDSLIYTIIRNNSGTLDISLNCVTACLSPVEE